MAKHERRAAGESCHQVDEHARLQILADSRLPASRLVFFPSSLALSVHHFPPRRRTHVRDERQGEQAQARHRPDRGAELRPEPGARGHRGPVSHGGSPKPIRDPPGRIPPGGPRGEPRVARAAPVPPAAHVSAVVAHGRHARHPHPDDAPRQPRVHLQPLRLLRRPTHVPRRDVLHAVPGGPRRVGRQSRRLLRHRLDHPRPLAAQSAASRPR